MIRFPKSLDEVSGGEIRAGGSDLQDRRHLGLSTGELVDLRDLPGLDTMDGGRIGAKVTLATLAEELAGYPGVAQAAGALATPQIRAVATLGGSLLQSNRCWYFRRPDASCHRTGGDTCPAREGDHLFHGCFDMGPCIAPHPSTMGMALLAYDAKVSIHGAEDRAVKDLLGDPTREHTLKPGEILTFVKLPEPMGEKAAYLRAISRARAEWPLVEAIACLVLDGETIRSARVAMGGVAPIPLRLSEVEKELEGAKIGDDTFAKAGGTAARGAKPFPMTGYKIPLIHATVREVLRMAAAS